MLEYLIQNAPFTIIVIVLFIALSCYYSANKYKKAEIEVNNVYINKLERQIECKSDLLQHYKRERLTQAFGPVEVYKPKPQETVSYNDLLKTNEVIHYKGKTYQVSKSEYLEDPWTKIEKMHYYLMDEQGNTIIRSHYDLMLENIDYAFKRK